MNVEPVREQDESKSEKKLTFWKKLKKAYLEYKPYLVSHHPNCQKYDEHIFRIRGTKFCIGCFIGYPSALIGIGISFPLIYYEIVNKWIFLSLGIVFSCALLLSLSQFTKKRARKIIQKLLIGLGSGFILSFLWTIMNFAWYFKVLILWGAIIVLNIPISIMHYKTHDKICRNCEWKDDWKTCPGFQQNEKQSEE